MIAIGEVLALNILSGSLCNLNVRLSSGVMVLLRLTRCKIPFSCKAMVV